MSDEAWRAAYGIGCMTWPELPVTLETFRARAQAVGVEEVPESFAAGDFFLACACLAGGADAIATFDREFILPARFSIARVRADDDFIEDVLQELRQKLLAGAPARLASYSGRGALTSWVRVAATRTALDKADRAESRVAAHYAADLADVVASENREPELELLRQRYHEVFRTSLAVAIEELTPQERNLLRMSVLDGLSIDEIAVPYGVHRATVARWLQTARERIFDSVRAKLRTSTGLGDSEFEDLARAVQSLLHLSLSRLLRGPMPVDRSGD